LHNLTASFVLGYHGCDRSVGERLLSGEPFSPSDNDHDWLGPGIYFWEANPLRGLQYANELKKRPNGPKITEPYVVGAAIDCGYCLDLVASTGIEAVRRAYEDFAALCQAARVEMPKNVLGSDLLLRRLDCAVIKHLHGLRAKLNQRPFDSAKGVFREGDPIYELSGFYQKTHIQVCVVDVSCIKGVFRVPSDHLNLPGDRTRGYA
jgi:hypothetical protein